MILPDSGDLFTPKSDTLDTLLPSIHDHRIALPDFQRPWVWRPEMVRDLLISVAYRYPAGSLLTMPVLNQHFATRPFQGAGDVLRGRPNVIILDGQQRLTSLYQSLFRQTGVEHEGQTYFFYLDVPMLLMDPDGLQAGDPYFDKALFYVRAERKTGRRVRYDGLQEMYEITTVDQELAAGALPLGILFDVNGKLADWTTQYQLRHSGGDMQAFIELGDKWRLLVQPWLNRVRTYRFPVVELDERMPLGAICHIFEKVNSTGVSLDVFDLCTAILWAQGYRLNVEWENTQKRLKENTPIRHVQALSGTYFLMGIALLDSLARKREHPEQNLSVNCRKQDLMALDRATVSKWWPVLEDGYVAAVKFMTEQGVISTRILPYSTLIVPLSAMLADVKCRFGDVRMGPAWKKIEQWYWCSVFSQRYSSQVEYASARDYEQVMRWVEGGDPPDVVRTFAFRSDSLQEIRSIRNAIYKGVLCLIARSNAKDFCGEGKLSTQLFYDTRQDHHHIFPTRALAQMEIQDARADTIVNKTLISASCNRSIGGRPPSSYVKKWRSDLGAGAYDSILRSHLIDPELLATDNWDAFVTSRRERLRELIIAACGGNVLPFSGRVEIDADVDEEEE
jgi:hypothetical protein